MNKIIYLSILTLILFTGCFQKVDTPIYVNSKAPILENYDSKQKYDFGTLYNKDSDVCIVKWNVCVPKKEFAELVDYMQTNKSDLTKHQTQVNIYNKWANEQNIK